MPGIGSEASGITWCDVILIWQFAWGEGGGPSMQSYTVPYPKTTTLASADASCHNSLNIHAWPDKPMLPLPLCLI